MGFTREQLLTYRDTTVADLIGDEVRLLIVGINPGLWTAATQTHFAYPGNRFYPALHRAGITPHELEYRDGLSGDDRDLLLRAGIAITNVCPRATAKASELTRDELRRGGVELIDRVERLSPAVVAVAGITAYRSAFARPRAVLGRQEDGPTGHDWWAVPNPSGLNAHETVDSLASWYRDVAVAAGVPVERRPDPPPHGRGSSTPGG